MLITSTHSALFGGLIHTQHQRDSPPKIRVPQISSFVMPGICSAQLWVGLHEVHFLLPRMVLRSVGACHMLPNAMCASRLAGILKTNDNHVFVEKLGFARIQCPTYIAFLGAIALVEPHETSNAPSAEPSNR